MFLMEQTFVKFVTFLIKQKAPIMGYLFQTNRIYKTESVLGLCSCKMSTASNKQELGYGLLNTLESIKTQALLTQNTQKVSEMFANIIECFHQEKR